MTIRICEAAGQPLEVPYDVDVSTDTVRVLSIRAHRGPLTVKGLVPTRRYHVLVVAARYRPVSRFAWAGPPLEVRLPIDPDLVAAIEWPAVYPVSLTAIVPLSEIAALAEERRAGLLNLYTKLHLADLWRYVRGVREVRRDRIFANVDPAIDPTLEDARGWVAVNGSLHEPPPGYTRAGSWKERDVPAGGLQVTLFSRGSDYRADLDIDDAAGIGHVFQVVRNRVTGEPTHPYDIHQILVAQGIDPGYRLVA